MIVAEGNTPPLRPLIVQELQWGRNMIVAEGPRPRILALSGPFPLQWGRNMIVAEGFQP